MAHELLAQFGSLSAVLEADASELLRVAGVGENTAALITLMPELFGYYQRNALGAKPVVTNLAEAKTYCESLFFGAHEEMAYVICLDQSGRVLHPALLRRGTVDEVNIYPREVVEAVIRYHAHSVVLAHNHPGGSPNPSQADVDSTTRIARALRSIDVSLMDHLIFSGSEVYSMMREIFGAEGCGSERATDSASICREESDRKSEITLGDRLIDRYGGD